MKFNLKLLATKVNIKPELLLIKETEIFCVEYQDILVSSFPIVPGTIIILRENNKITKGELEILFSSLIENKIEILIVQHNKNFNEILKHAKENNISLFSTELSPRETINTIEKYLIRKYSVSKRIHGTMMSVYGEGVLIIGKSGIGKSELALELINKNHFFIGDDAIDAQAVSGKVIMKAPRAIRSFIEVRGLGVINARDMFGIEAMMHESFLDLTIELVDLASVKSVIERLGEKRLNYKIVGINIPKIQIPVDKGRNLSSIVEAAVISHKQRKYDNYIAIDDLQSRLFKK
ncbi:MAG: hypothetical protein GQ557_02000 [Mycoplasmataceae bacterium]|nr:hypothetical protein [Mycoplasmataceae bacterium]